MTEETILEINLSDLENNIRYLKTNLRPNTKFLAVVKASSYGNNAVAIATHIQKKKLADYLAVAYVFEGSLLRNSGIRLPVMVLHAQAVNFDEICQQNMEPVLYSKRILRQFLKYAEDKKLRHYPIHLKCNTGLNRLGFSITEIDEVLNELKTSSLVEVKTAFSHLGASEDLNEREFTETQIETFKLFQKKITQTFPYQVIYHMCNTSGILNYPEAQFDMVRSGIGMYGFANDPKKQPNFKPIGTLKSVISQIHQLLEGESVGYNRGFIAQKPIKTATIPVGHADGINRIYGKGKGFVYIHNQKAPILGNVCMDMLMVDITNIDCEEGDEVIVFGKNHTAEALAENAGTISYELITSMSFRIKRVYIEV